VAISESRAWIKHAPGGDTFVTENAAFDFIRLQSDDGRSYSQLLVRQIDHNEWSEGREGINGTVTVTATHKPGDQKTLWTFNAPGNSGRSLPGLDLFQVSRVPCCSAPFQSIYYSLLNGKRLYVSNGQPDERSITEDSGLIRIDGGYNGKGYTQTRYISFGAIDGEEIPSLQYGTEKLIKQRLFLRGHEYGDNFDVPNLSITQDGTKLENSMSLEGPFSFIIIIRFNEVPEIRIPVENDVVLADRAILPSGYTLSLK